MCNGVLGRWLLVAFVVLSVGLLGWPARAGAQIPGAVPNPVGTVTGPGGVVGGSTTVLFDTGMLAAGSLDSLYSEGDAISTSMVTAEVPSARVVGYVDLVASESYLASINLTLPGITIAAASAEAAARGPLTGGSGTGTAYIARLSINGVDVLVDGTVNQTITSPVGQLIINEQQIQPDGTIVVSALHVIVYGVADVVVASAMAGARGGNAYAVRIKIP